jgi:hypothetical protein
MLISQVGAIALSLDPKKAYRFSIHTHPEINFMGNSENRLKPTAKPKGYQ